MLFQPNTSTVFVTAAALVVASQPMAWAANAKLGVASYDAQRHAIVVPYSGTFPTYASDSLTGPARVYFDFNADAAFIGVPSQAVTGETNLVRWAMAKRGRQVRLVLTLKTPGRVLVLNDASRHQVVLVPQGPGMTAPALPSATPTPAPTAKPAAKPTAKPVGRVHTFNQTFGQTDFTYAVGPRNPGAKRDQVSVNVRSSGITDFHVTSEPERDYVAFSISVQGKPAATPKPAAKPTAKPVAKPTAKPKPTPKPMSTPTPLPTPEETPMALPTPEETPTPLPTPEETPTPLATPEATPSPEATPAPVSEEPTEPGSTLSFYGAYPVSVDEVTTSAASGFSLTDPTSLQGGSYEARFGGNWSFLLGLQHLSYKITDQQTDNQTAHLRDEYEALTGVGYRFKPLGTEEMLGVGYIARYLSTNNQDTSGAPTGTPSGTPSTLTAPSQLWHGPALLGRIDLPFLGWLGVEARGGVAPYMLGALQSPTSLEGMFGYWVVPTAYVRFGLFQLNAGYSLYNYSVADYGYMRMGPFARVDLRF